MTLEHPFPNGLVDFRPPRCPLRGCPSFNRNAPFLWQRKGFYRRKCDGLAVQRFQCLTCRLGFSTQTFRVDYRLHKPTLHFALFDAFVSKVTQRQAARTLECTRKTVRQRLLLLSRQSQDFHAEVLKRERRKGGLPGDYQLDELETFEHSRRLAPVTMPVLIEQHTFFVVHATVGALPARGNLRPRDVAKKLEREKLNGPRLSESRAAVERCFQVLGECVDRARHLVVATDKKTTYPGLLAARLPGTYTHARHDSTAERTRHNPLFPINHILGMLRDGPSRLVRRSWAASKERRWLELHVWIWIAYRNYIRGITNKSRWMTSAEVLGVVTRRFTKRSFFEWRVALSQ